MLASLVLAASLVGQSPPSGGTLIVTPPAFAFWPGPTIRAGAMEPALLNSNSLGPFANKGHEKHAFVVIQPPPNAPAGLYRMIGVRPWYFVPPSFYGGR